MGLNRNRMTHCLEVAKLMKELALKAHPGEYCWAEGMFTLGLLHDIGYEFTDSAAEHAHKGGQHLKGSNYLYWKEVYYHGDSKSIYHSEALDLLNTADLQVTADGHRVTVAERLKDIKTRHGINSPLYKNLKSLAQQLRLI